jgi:membrane protein implicated in regulation of membrane protease activity
MHIVAIAWTFVVVLMAAAEATSTQGTVLGALFTLLLYGVLPLTIVLYILGTPARRRARLQAEHSASAAAESAEAQGDASSHAAGDPVAAERKEP